MSIAIAMKQTLSKLRNFSTKTDNEPAKTLAVEGIRPGTLWPEGHETSLRAALRLSGKPGKFVRRTVCMPAEYPVRTMREKDTQKVLRASRGSRVRSLH